MRRSWIFLLFNTVLWLTPVHDTEFNSGIVTCVWPKSCGGSLDFPAFFVHFRYHSSYGSAVESLQHAIPTEWPLHVINSNKICLKIYWIIFIYMLIYIKAYFKRNLRYIESYTIYILMAFQESMFFIPINCKTQERTERVSKISSCT